MWSRASTQRMSQFQIHGIFGQNIYICIRLIISIVIYSSWQPERQVPFSDVRMPPPADGKKDIGEGEEVEVSMDHTVQTFKTFHAVINDH